VRQFASSGFRIWNLSREAKWVYTGFAVFSLLALVVSGLFYDELVGRGIARYYLGDTPAASAAAPGPRVDVEPGEGLALGVSYRKLLEVTHFHLFTVPVFLLITAHLFMLTALGTRQKIFWIISAWLSALVHMAAPWLVRFVSAKMSFMYSVSGAAMAVSWGALTLYPVVVMWLPPKEAESE
jgi:hypothetical protein